MKREDLKKQGLTDEQIDFVMAENGKDIEKYKNLADTRKTEIDNLERQLETANKEIEEFKDLDIEEIKQKADDYKKKYELEKKESKKRLEELKFEHLLNNKLRDARAKSIKAVKALLDFDVLKLEGEEIKGLDAELERLQKEYEYQFETETADKPNFIRPGDKADKQDSGKPSIGQKIARQFKAAQQSSQDAQKYYFND